MTQTIAPNQILFLDIETVPLFDSYDKLPERHSKLWDLKFEQFKKRNPERYPENYSTSDAFEAEGGIFAEFGKIICISVGVIVERDKEQKFRLKSFAGDDEKDLLTSFANMLDSWLDKDRKLCGHNIKEFDVPFICRRMLINNIPLPDALNVAGKKPWEVPFLDTLELWKFGDYKHYTSLNLLTAIFDIPTPKDDIDGSMVSEVYYKEKNLKRIMEYCEKDVFATAQVYLRLSSLPLIDPKNVQSAEA